MEGPGYANVPAKKSAKHRQPDNPTASVGKMPGTLTYIGRPKIRDARVLLTEYNAEMFQEKVWKRVKPVERLENNQTVAWLDVDGLHSPEVVSTLGESFQLNRLWMEDILDTTQKPKLEEADDKLFVIMKRLFYQEATQEVAVEHVALVLSGHYVLSFQEDPAEDGLHFVRERLRHATGRIRSRQADYLLYALLDTIVDQYFLVLEKIATQIEELENEILEDASEASLRRLYRLRRELTLVRRAIWPAREVVSSLQRKESALVDEAVYPYLRDLYDHTVQVIDTTETYRELLGGLLDMYHSTASNRTNQIMQVLTVISTIFIPLTFIVGVYGMNFAYMPELDERPAYFVVWGIMLAIAGGLLVYFRRKRWI